MRSGRMAWRAARLSDMTMTPSRVSTSKAGRVAGSLMGMADLGKGSGLGGWQGARKAHQPRIRRPIAAATTALKPASSTTPAISAAGTVTPQSRAIAA